MATVPKMKTKVEPVPVSRELETLAAILTELRLMRSDLGEILHRTPKPIRAVDLLS